MKFQLLKGHRKHLEIHDTVVAALDRDQAAHHIGQHGASNPALHAGECVFLVAGCHICNRDFQFPLHGMTSISLVGFQDVQHITGCPEFLFNGVYKSGQLGFDFFPALLNDLVRSFLLFEVNCHRQKHNDRRKDRENQKGRDNQQSNQPSLYPGRRNIGFRGHFNFSGFQLRLQLLPLIVVQMYQWRKPRRHIEQDSVDAAFLGLPSARYGQNRLCACGSRQPEQPGQ